MAYLPEDIQAMCKQYPILKQVMKKQPTLWENPNYIANPSFPINGVKEDVMIDAKARMNRFEPLIKALFPEAIKGIVSPIVEIPKMKTELEKYYHTSVYEKLFVKRDDVLPVAGSIKARGGFHEVLAFAESLALEKGLLMGTDDDYIHLLSDQARQLFSQYTISVGSTGNLGLSIGMIGAALGFSVVVHMSLDAKQWKKDLLREHNVKVVEHTSDYSKAVDMARKESEANSKSYFVDDEQSRLLFAGYSIAALEVQEQLQQLGVEVNSEQPLYVYLPCGVGGGPGGVAFGLKSVFGENVHCLFAEPTHSPCMLVGLVTKLHNQISVQDFGLDNKTEADGLAVGRASVFVGKMMEDLLSGSYTITDDELISLLYLLDKSENIFLEPSALAGMKGPALVSASIKKQAKDQNPIHLVWATGGSLVPADIKEEFISRGKGL